VLNVDSVYDWEAFSVGDSVYLVSAEYSITDSHHTTTTSTTDAAADDVAMTTSSAIYRWQGAEKFVLVHRLNTPPATDWETFTTRTGDVYLVCANAVAGVSQLFKVKMV